jgi:phage FluMu gp28-like protein
MTQAVHRTPDDTAWKQFRSAVLAELPGREREAFTTWAKTFYGFQLQWLFEPEDYAACVKSRQSGFSHTTAAAVTLWGAAFGETSTLISVGQREAQEVLDKARAHAGLLVDCGSKWAAIKGKDSAEELRFASGGRLIALPQTSGGRSFSGNVFLDEYAYLMDPEKVWDGASAVTMHGFRLRVASTPNGVGNSFHGLITDPKQHAGYALHTIPIQRAIDDGMRIDMDRCWKMAKGDPRIFDQLFNCKFIDGQQQYIPTAAINECSVDDCYVWGQGEYYAGLDIGKDNDLVALIVLWVGADGRSTVVSIRTCKRSTLDMIAQLVAESFRRYQWRRLAVDSTGLGVFPAEELQKVYGRSRVEPVVFTQSSKEDLATTLYMQLVDGAIRMPVRDGIIADEEPRAAESLRADLCALRRIVTSAGNIRYDAPRTTEGHADRAWALALALHAAKRPGATRVVR